jgi:cephalosporin hydroxylase
VLGSEALSRLILAVASGQEDAAKHLLLSSDELDDEERSDLVEALSTADAPSERLACLGDVLRVRGCDRNLVNEFYRASYHMGPTWARDLENPLHCYFAANRSGRILDKWPHYFHAYHRHLSHLRGRSPRVLEIGVFNGGGLDMWAWYFGPGAELVGLDIDENARAASDPRHVVLIGDQADEEFLRRVIEKHGPFDVVIDDGGHTMAQQITSITTIFPVLPDGAVYIVEDCHTSYWPAYGGGLQNPSSFLEWVKRRIDDVHGYHIPGGDHVHDLWTRSVEAMHLYDSVVVFDKTARSAPFAELVGTLDYVDLPRPPGLVEATLLAQQQASAVQRDEARSAAALATEEARLLQEERDRVVRERDELNESAEQARSELLESYQHIQALRRTLSWRITSPIRRVRDLVRRG